MKNGHLVFFLLILGLLLCTATVSGSFGTTGEPADILLLNGTIYTVQPGIAWDQKPVDALAIRGDRIVFVSSTATALSFLGKNTRIIDLKGKMVLPGFIDSHAHYGSSAIFYAGVNFIGGETIADYQQEIRQYARDNPDVRVIRGVGWDYDLFSASGPDKSLIDEIVPDRPVVLVAYDGHATWVNSKALEIAGITNATPDPLGARIERDALGNPTGTLREFLAADLVNEKLPPITAKEITAAIQYNVESGSHYGVTTAHDALIQPPVGEVFSTLEAEGNLPVRIFGETLTDQETGQDQIPALLASRSNHSSAYRETSLTPACKNNNPLSSVPSYEESSTCPVSPAVSTNKSRLFFLKTVKLLSDGVVEGHTAVLLAPYTDNPQSSGTPVWDRQAFFAMIQALDKEGFQIDIHAIGDGGVRMSLDAFENARNINGPRDSRHKISHIQLVSPADYARFRELGVIATMQPNWFYNDTNAFDITMAFLGSDREEHMYSVKSLQDAGATVAFGSDWPVGTNDITMNPLDGIQSAVTRQPFRLTPDVVAPYRPDQKISLKSAIEAATINGAFASFMENETGSLEPGKLADLVILDRNIFTVPADEINTAQVVSTFLAGKEVYHRDTPGEKSSPGIVGIFAQDAGMTGPEGLSGWVCGTGTSKGCSFVIIANLTPSLLQK